LRGFVALWVLALISVAPGARAQDGDLRRAFDALEAYQTAEAARILQAMEGDGGADGALARALVAQHLGDHEAVLAELEDVASGGRLQHLEDAARASIQGLGDVKEASSAHFRVRYADGLDHLMVDRALEVLERSYEAVGRDLDLYPDGEVLVDIYPTSASFSAAAGLPAEAVANETVGLCRWDRLLITSPAAAPFGYPWADTLCHEYTHLVVNRIGGGQVPVWLHEGIASFEQRRWRGESDLLLDPYATERLLDSLSTGDLVTLEEIGNCLACLDGKDRVQLAFAQVHFMVDHLVRARGIGAVHDVLEALRAGATVRDAVAAAWEGEFEAFEASWQRTALASLTAQGDDAGLVMLGLDASTAADAATPAADSLLAGRTDGADHARLGDLLLGRGQLLPALIEYERADEALEEVSPSLACKRAHTLQRLGESRRALDTVEEARTLYPEFEPLHVHAAAAQMQLGRTEDALRSLDEAVLLNPFDPRIYAWRLELVRDDPDAADEARRALDALTRERR
jgi:tetratricopeptide (TPR) repeat protein